jgi:Fe-S-cluster containining protein
MPLLCDVGRVRFDCQSCGACCCNSDENRAELYRDYVQVAHRSSLAKHPALLSKLTVLNARGERHLRLIGREQRCAALRGELGARVSCIIYELRPEGCRKVEPGSKECRRARRERGVDPV